MMNDMMYKAVRMTTDLMTDMELAAIYNAATAGFDPTRVMGYEKAQDLFTEDNETRMHQATLEVYGTIVGERLVQRGRIFQLENTATEQ